MNCPKDRTEDGPIRVKAGFALPYAAMADYIRNFPDKLASFVAGRLCDDDFRPFAQELYEYLRETDFEEWRL